MSATDSVSPSAAGPRMGTVEALRRLASRRDDDAWSAILINHGAGIFRLAERLGGPALANALTSSTAGGTSLLTSIAFQQPAWQALLHSSQAPAFAGIVKWGGLAIMSKYIVGAAALLALTLSGVQTWRMSVLTGELNQ